VEHHLEQNIAEFLSELGDVIGLYGVDRLVGFFHHVLRNRAVRLLAVPRTPVRRTQGGYHFNELVEPVCHDSPRRASMNRYLVAVVVLLPLPAAALRSAARISILAFLRRSSRNVW